MKIQKNKHTLLKAIVLAALAVGFFYASFALAVTGATTLSGVATNLQGSFKSLAKLITGASYLTGLGFAVAAILKFKAHKDNPTQIPVGTPIALLFIAVAFLFLPAIFKAAGTTIFGSGASGSISGVSGF